MKLICYALSLIIIAFNSISVFGQRQYETNPDAKRANIWYFGQNAGINFNTNPPTALTDGKVDAIEGCASICDTSGNLLFYTDGRTVWDRNHNVIEIGLKGHPSSTQVTTILNHPENDSIYYIFTTPFEYSEGIYFNILNINLNNGLGRIIEKNILLNATSTEKLTAINHQNGKDIWIVGHTFINNTFFAYLLTGKGIIKCPNLSNSGSVLDNLGAFKGNMEGYIRISHNSKIIANCIPFNNKIELFNFYNINGNIEFYKTINLPFYPYGIDLSSDDKNLFITGFKNDTNFICVYNVLNNNFRIIKKFELGQIQSIQLARNNLLYLATNDSLKLKAIDSINDYSLAFFNPSKDIDLQAPKKSSYGLPNFNQSYFYIPSIDFSYQLNCIDNSILLNGLDTFGGNIHTWKINKLNKPIEATYSSKSPSHIFIDTGNYEILYFVQSGSRVDSIKKQIVIYSKIKKNFLGKDTAFQIGDIINKVLHAPNDMRCYKWQDSSHSSTFIATKKGIYTCQITNQGFCEVIDTIIIKECLSLSIPSIFKGQSDTLFCNHLNADTFIWFRNNLPYKTTYTNGTNESYLKLSDTGTYRVEAVKYGHCNRSSASININKLGIRNIILQSVQIFPNPNNGTFKIINYSDDVLDFRITNNLGQELYTYHSLIGENFINTDLKEGLYIITFNIQNHTIRQKLIIQ